MKFIPPEYDSHKMFNFKPDMWIKEIKYLENLIIEKLNRSEKLDILEWGSGNSTLYFSLFLKAMGANFKWLALEHFIPWYNKVTNFIKENNLQENTKCCLVSPTKEKNKIKQENNPMIEYITYSYSAKNKFDMVIVDGRKRDQCLKHAMNFIKDSGVVVLHDAERVEYHKYLKKYKEGGNFVLQIKSPNSQGGVQKLWVGKKN